MAKEQVLQTELMTLATERYFNSLNDLFDETNYILTDWSTPMVELASAAKDKIYKRCLEVEKNQLRDSLQVHHFELQRN